MRRHGEGLGPGAGPGPSAHRHPPAGRQDVVEEPFRLVAFPDEVAVPKAACFALADLLWQVGEVLGDEPGARTRALAARAAAWGAGVEAALCVQARWQPVSGPPSP